MQIVAVFALQFPERERDRERVEKGKKGNSRLPLYRNPAIWIFRSLWGIGRVTFTIVREDRFPPACKWTVKVTILFRAHRNLYSGSSPLRFGSVTVARRNERKGWEFFYRGGNKIFRSNRFCAGLSLDI